MVSHSFLLAVELQDESQGQQCIAVRQWSWRDEEEVLELGWFLLQVCLEGAAGSAWMQRGGKLLGVTLAVLPRTGACILVGMSVLGLEVLKLEKGVCLFPRKLRQDLGPPSSLKGSVAAVGSAGNPLWRRKIRGARQWMNE